MSDVSIDRSSGAARGEPMLDCRQLTRVYSEGPQDITVLDHLDLQVAAGERVAASMPRRQAPAWRSTS